MINFGDVFFCEKVIQSPTGSLCKIINRFYRLQVQSYPYLFRSTLVINFTYDEALNCALAIRFKNSNGLIIFHSALRSIHCNEPIMPVREADLIIEFLEIRIPKPGNYTVEILLNNIVEHVEHLSLA